MALQRYRSRKRVKIVCSPTQSLWSVMKYTIVMATVNIATRPIRDLRGTRVWRAGTLETEHMNTSVIKRAMV